MVSWGSIKFASRYPKIAAAVLWRDYQERQKPAYDLTGMDIHEADWDICIILDACRYDVFSNHHKFDGTLTRVRSRGSTSQEWVRGNFSNSEFGDLVVVTSNPFYEKLAEEIGIRVHHFEWVEPSEDDMIVPRPETMTEAVLDIAEEFPNKRILAHYMQPHAPYIGSSEGSIDMGDEHLHKAVKRGGVSKKEVFDAYIENFTLVQEGIQPVIDHVEGKKVISADHGELLGDPLLQKFGLGSFYGHPYGCNHDAVRMVPWLELPHSSRREIKPGRAHLIGGEKEEDKVEDHLQALGYMR